MPGNFQVICGSMVSENGQLPASTETPVYGVLFYSIDNLNGWGMGCAPFLPQMCLVFTLKSQSKNRTSLTAFFLISKSH